MFHVLMTVALVTAPQQIDTTLAVRAGGRLEIENHQGSIVVRAWDRDAVRVRARHGSETGVEIDRSGSTIHIEARSRRGLSTVRYEITVPVSFDIDIEAMNSSLDLTGVSGDIDVETLNGDVTLSAVRGRISAETTNGRVVIRDSRGELAIESVNQGILIDDHDGGIRAEAVNGHIVLNRIRSDAIDVETVNGNVEFSGEIRDRGRYVLATHNGNIVMAVPDGTNADVALETYRGRLDSDFPIQMRGGSGRRSMSFTIGRGGARIELSSFGGSIRLRRPDGRSL